MIYDPACRRCPLNVGPRSAGMRVCVPGDGPRPARIMFFGEAPAANEERQERPFVGDAGHELDDVLERAGLSRSEVFLANVLRCRLPQGHKPNVAEVDACRYYSVQELEEVKPSVIVALGGSALKALTGKSAIGENRGKLLPLLPAYRHSARVLATYHPAAYLHNPANRVPYSAALVEDIRLAQRIAQPDGLEPARVVLEEPKARRALSHLYKSCETLACDLEWEVLRPRNGPAGSYPWSKRGGKAPQALTISFAGRLKDGIVLACALRFTEGNRRAIAKVLAERKIILHGGAGDLIWLYAMGYTAVRIAHDTLLLASLHNLDTSLSLAALASTLTDMPPDWKQETEETIGRAPRTGAEWTTLLDRNAKDAAATLLLFDALKGRRISRQAARLYKHVLMPAVRQLARASLHGIPMDRGMLSRIDTAARKRIRTEREQAGDLLGLDGDYETVLNSDAKLGPALERVLGVKLPLTEKTQRPSVTKDVLAQYQGKHPSVPHIQKARHLTTLKTNYLDPWQMLLELQGDDNLHTMYRLATARTGRTSAEAEAGATFQQFPREEVFKRCMRAPDGHKIIHVDQSQIEMRIAAWLSGERRMVQFLRDGVDMHEVIAGWIQALSKGYTIERYLAEKESWMEKVTKGQRRSGKVYNFGLLFGGTWRVIVRLGRQDYGITLSQPEAERGHNAYHQMYPDLRPWHESFRPMIEQGYVDLPTGRRRTIVGLEYEDEEGKLRKLINAGPQGIASDISLFCANVTYDFAEEVLAEYFEENVRYVGFFHDAGIYVVSDECVELMRNLIRDVWEDPPLERLGLELTVPLRADVGVGQTWEDAINDAA